MQTQTIWPLTKAEDLLGFSTSLQPLALWRRPPAPGSAALMDSVLPELGEFRQVLSPEELRHRLASAFPARFWRNPVGLEWLQDVTELTQVFCRELAVTHCQVQLEKERPCVRYHADNVPLRLVCAYRGPGTLWLDQDNFDPANAQALRPQDVHQAGEWEVLVMKGKLGNVSPLYHKSPPARPGDPLSLVLKLDLV